MPANTISRPKVDWPRVAFLPGLEPTQGPNAPNVPYRTPFFGADREYAEDEGWTTIRYRSRSRKTQRRWRDLDE